MIKTYDKIKIEGVETEIISYESALQILKNRYRFILPTKEYLSAFFNNLGYKMRPKNFDFIDKLIPIENIEFTDLIVINHNVSELYIFNNGDSLAGILDAIEFWCKGKLYNGFILNPKFTYKDPVSQSELEWSKQNNFDIKRPAIISDKQIQWYGSDIRTARLYNINPNINEEYFEKNIINFDMVSRRVYIEDTYLLFIMAVVEPDSIMALLRRVEMEAVEKVVMEKCDGYVMELSPLMVVDDYTAILRCYMNQIYNIHSKYGLKGLVNFAMSVNQEKNLSRILAQNLYSGYTVPDNALNASMEEGSFIDKFSMLTLDQKKQYVSDLEMTSKNGNIISIVNRYVDTSNLNKLLKRKIALDPDIYRDTVKNLYILISQISIYIPNYINGVVEKLILSKNLFIDKNNFGLFNKNFDNFIFIDENYNICMCDIDKVGKFIKDNNHKDVRLVPKEDMGNKKLEKEIPDLVFEYDEIMKQEEISHQVPVYTDILRIDEIKKEDETYGLEGLIVE